MTSTWNRIKEIQNSIEKHNDYRVINLSTGEPNAQIMAALLHDIIPSDREHDFRFISPGRSGAKVIMVMFSDNTVPLLVKFGDIAIIEKEINNYNEFGKDLHSAYRVELRSNIITAETFGAIAFSWAGGYGDIKTFRDFFVSASKEHLKSILQSFSTILFRWHNTQRGAELPFDQWQWDRSGIEKISTIINNSSISSTDKTRIINAVSIPVEWRNRLTTKTSTKGLCHGDLNVNNILIAKAGTAFIPILIDYASIRKDRSPAHDWAKLEREIKFRCILKSLSQMDNFPRLVALIDQAVCNGNCPMDTDSNLIMAIRLIRLIRQQFINNINSLSDISSIEYLFFLFQWSLAYLIGQDTEVQEMEIRNTIIHSALFTLNTLEQAINNPEMRLDKITIPENITYHEKRDIINNNRTTIVNELAYIAMDSNRIKRQLIIDKLTALYKGRHTWAIIFNAKSGSGKATVISQYVESIKRNVNHIKTIVKVIEKSNTQKFLRDLGESYGIISSSGPLQTDIAYQLYDKIRDENMILVLYNFDLLLNNEGKIDDKEIETLLLLVMQRGFNNNAMIILSSNKPINGFDRDSDYCKVFTANDLKFNEQEGIQLIKKYKIKGTDEELQNFLYSYNFDPNTVDNVARKEQGHHVNEITHTTYSDLVQMNLDKISDASKNLLFFISLFLSEKTEKLLISQLIHDHKNPLYISFTSFEASIEELRKLELITENIINNNIILIIHGLTKYLVKEEFKNTYNDGFIKCNELLYDYYTKVYYDIGIKNNIDPLYNAVWHGCNAKKYTESLRLFWNEILRKREFYSQTMGYYLRDFYCLSNFFQGTDKILPVNELDEDAREWLPSVYSYLLKNLGRVKKAIDIRESQVKRAEERRANDNPLDAPTYLLAAIDVSRLMQLLAYIGELEKAEKYFKKAIDFAERGKEQKNKNYYSNELTYEWTMRNVYGKMGVVCCLQKKYDESLEYFRLADIECGSRLEGADDVYYCEILSDNPNTFSFAEKRMEKGMEIAQEKKDQEKIVYYYLIKARLLEKKKASITEIIDSYNKAYEILIKINRVDMTTWLLVLKLHYMTKPEVIINFTEDDPIHGIIRNDLQMIENNIINYELDLFRIDLDIIKLKLSAKQKSSEEIEKQKKQITNHIKLKKYFYAQTKLDEFLKQTTEM